MVVMNFDERAQTTWSVARRTVTAVFKFVVVAIAAFIALLVLPVLILSKICLKSGEYWD